MSRSCTGPKSDGSWKTTLSFVKTETGCSIYVAWFLSYSCSSCFSGGLHVVHRNTVLPLSEMHESRTIVLRELTPLSAQGSFGNKYQACRAGSCHSQCKNLAESCFIEGTGNDIWKNMICIWLSNISDYCIKLNLAQTRIDAQAPFLTCQIQWTQPLFLWYNRLSAWLLSPCVSVRLFMVSKSTNRLLY